MPIVALPKQRHVMQEDGSSLKFIIPSRKNYLAMLILGFWLIGWAFGEIMVGGMFLVGILKVLFNASEILPQIGGSELVGLSGGGLFMLVWLTFWTVGGGFALYTFLWQLTGKENIEITSDMIQIQRAVFGLGRKKEYSGTHIKDLRVTPWAADHHVFGWSGNTSYWGVSNGLLAFDYGAKTLRFGGGIDEAEAKQILEKIGTHFPQYRAHNREPV